MKKLLTSLVLLGAISFAEPMPEGSKQYEVMNSYRDISAAIFVTCPPELNRPSVEVMCSSSFIDSYAVMPLFDEAAIQANDLSPVEDFWQYVEGESRYHRSYRFADGGIIEAIFAPDDNNQLYVFHTP